MLKLVHCRAGQGREMQTTLLLFVEIPSRHGREHELHGVTGNASNAQRQPPPSSAVWQCCYRRLGCHLHNSAPLMLPTSKGFCSS